MSDKTIRRFKSSDSRHFVSKASQKGTMKKISQYERVVHSSTAVAFTGGMKENLNCQAQIAIERLLKSIGQNARGDFRFRVSFVPDGKEA